MSRCYHCDIDTSREKQVPFFKNIIFSGNEMSKYM